jgi:anaerobic magnesium-protoporphyrin IX monomethyl ester cyclase
MRHDFKTDIQLINVADKGDLHNRGDYPYGMALIQAYLQQEGVESLMLQYPIWLKEEFIDDILENPAYVYGFQVNFENYEDIQELVKIIKNSNPDGKIIFGGPFVVSLYEEILKNDTVLDAIVLGEGEYTLVDLIKTIKEDPSNWKTINGLAWRADDGSIVMNPHRKAIKDLNEMPFATRKDIDPKGYDIEGKYIHDFRITTSRGCTSDCTFCAVNVNSKWQRASRWRGRDPINVVDEIQDLVENYNAKLINLQDSAFDDPGTLGPKRNRIFCEEILKRGLEVSMKAYFRAESVKDDAETIDLFKLYKEAGIDVLIIGAEAGSDYELEMYKKDATLEDNYRSFEVLGNLDLFFVHNGFIMYGPYTTLEALKSNYKFLFDNKLYYWYHNVDSSLILTPGAVIYDTMLEEGRVHGRKNFWETPAYDFLSPEILKLAQHSQELREAYPHLDVGSPLVLRAENLISRLKNKMNRNVAIMFEPEIREFSEMYFKNKNKFSDLGYQACKENLERVEKDGPNVDLMRSSEPFGQPWAEGVSEIQEGYDKILKTIESKGFGLGGLVFNAEFTARELRRAHLSEINTLSDDEKEKGSLSYS